MDTVYLFVPVYLGGGGCGGGGGEHTISEAEARAGSVTLLLS